MRGLRFLLVGTLFFGINAVAQYSSSGCVLVPHKLPEDLRSSLEERVRGFLAAQAEDHWEQVPDFLGRCRLGCNSGKFTQLYTSSYKRCMVSRMQEVRMLNFDFSIQNLSICATTSEEVESLGATVNRVAAEQSSWFLRGAARFRTSSEEWVEQTQLVAYRDQGQWYFVPPQWKMQGKWEKFHYTESDFAADHKQEIDVRNIPSSPVEITDIHAYMDRQYPSLRHMTFKLRNKTSKKITALTVWTHNETVAGEHFLGEGPIAPKGELTETDSGFSAYGDLCEGRYKQTMLIEDVDFADGSKWEYKPAADQKQ